MYKFHQITKSYFDNQLPFKLFIGKMSREKDPLIVSCQKLYRALMDREALAEAIDSAEESLFRTYSDNLDFKILLILLWAQVSTQYGRHLECKKLIKYGVNLLNKDTPLEFKAMLMISQGALDVAIGNTYNRVKPILEAIKLIGEKSVFYPKLSVLKQVRYAEMGKLSDISNSDLLIQNKIHKSAWYLYGYIHISNLIETGQAEKAFPLITKLIKLNEKEHVSPMQSIYIHESVLRFMKGERNHPVVKRNDFYKKAYQLHFDILDRKQDVEIKSIRDFFLQNPLSARNGGFWCYTLIRAECVCGNVEEVFKLISYRASHGDTHFVLNFFWARYYLLMNDKEKASLYYAKFSLDCERYHAENRLEIELDLATEISPKNLRFLIKSVALIKKSELKVLSIKPTEPQKIISPIKLLGNNDSIVEIKSSIKKYATLDISILITGETGVGKDVVAKMLHQQSPLSSEPFLAINCAAISDNLLQSELFGHEQGAFSGANKKRKGIFESAGKGYVFLDEIGDISPQAQVALLRVLENKEVRRIGSSTTIPIQCRIISATHVPLEEKVTSGLFRKDLLYRLKRLEVKIPPLRDRVEDIPTLTTYFFNLTKGQNSNIQLTDGLVEVLQGYPWPGNVRELKNEVERMGIIHSEKNTYTKEDFSLELKESSIVIEQQAKEVVAVSKPISQSVDQEKLTSLLTSGKSMIRRRERLRQLFKNNSVLTRAEIIKVLDVSPKTATADLQALIKEGYVKKVEPSSSVRSHYFELTIAL